MNYRKSAVFILFNVLILTNISLAQETMMNDFSYLYLEKLVAVAKENYPRAKAFNNRINIAKSNISAQTLSWLEPFSFSYYFRENNNAIDIVNPALLTGYQFGVSFNPGSLFRKPFAVKTAKEELKITKLEQQEYELQLETEVKTRYLQYLQNLNNLRLQSKVTIDAESMYKNIKSRYEKGEVPLADYNNVSVSLNAAYQAKIAAEAALITSKVSLEQLLVKKLEEIK